jgi:hypothetical protein
MTHPGVEQDGMRLVAQSDSQKAIEVLRANCTSGHGTTVQTPCLRFDSREALMKGSGKGPAITAGNSAQSRLMQLVPHSAQPSMPPGRKCRSTPDRRR